MTGIDKIKHWRETFGLPNREIPQTTTFEEAELALKLINEESRELLEALYETKESIGFHPYEPKLDQIADAIGDLYFVVTQAAMIHGLDPEMLIDRVYTSNMSKLADSEKGAQEAVDMYSQLNIETYYEQLPEGTYIIKRKSDNKILKGLNFKEPDWSDIK